MQRILFNYDLFCIGRGVSLESVHKQLREEAIGIEQAQDNTIYVFPHFLEVHLRNTTNMELGILDMPKLKFIYAPPKLEEFKQLQESLPICWSASSTANFDQEDWKRRHHALHSLSLEEQLDIIEGLITEYLA